MKCSIKNCDKVGAVIYKDKPICENHWIQHCDPKRRLNLKKVIK